MEKKAKGRILKLRASTSPLRYSHVKVVMSWEVGVEDKLLDQVTCGVKQDVLEHKERWDWCGSRATVGELVHLPLPG